MASVAVVSQWLTYWVVQAWDSIHNKHRIDRKNIECIHMNEKQRLAIYIAAHNIA